MHRRRLLASGATLATAGLAGCSGSGNGDADATATPTATPVPASEVAWREDDELNVEALVASHATTLLEAGSFAVVSTAETSHDGDQRPENWLYSQTYAAQFELARERQLLEQELAELDESQTAYVGGDTALYRLETDGEVQYSTESVQRTTEQFKNAMEQEGTAGVRGLDQWALTVDGAVARDGRTLTRFTGDEFTGERGIPSEIASASAEVLIDDDGVVRSISQTWEGTHEGQSVTVGVDVEFRGVGMTEVAEPDWAEDARESAGSDDGTESNTSGKLRSQV